MNACALVNVRVRSVCLCASVVHVSLSASALSYLVLSRHVVSCLVLSRLVSSAGSGKAGSDVRQDRAAESSSKAQVIKTVLSSDCCSDCFMSATATTN